jgi:hypothetical protein
MSVSLALCQPSDFNCDDGGCVDIGCRCDGQSDCQDGSDDMNCKTVEVPANYNKQLSPQTGEALTIVNISYEVIDMLDIDEKTGKMRVKFLLGTTWNDFRLMFLDLWSSTAMNLLNKAEMESIWYPFIVFENAELANFDFNVKTQIYVVQNVSVRNISYAPASQLFKAVVYQGSLNSLYWAASIRWLFV